MSDDKLWRGRAGHYEMVGLRLWRPAPRSGGGSYGWQPPTNVYETDEGIVVQVEVAGMRPRAIRVLLGPRHVTISGSRRPSPDLAGRISCRQVEIADGPFRSRIELPDGIDTEAVAASYRDGFILVELPFRRDERMRGGS